MTIYVVAVTACRHFCDTGSCRSSHLSAGHFAVAPAAQRFTAIGDILRPGSGIGLELADLGAPHVLPDAAPWAALAGLANDLFPGFKVGLKWGLKWG